MHYLDASNKGGRLGTIALSVAKVHHFLSIFLSCFSTHPQILYLPGSLLFFLETVFMFIKHVFKVLLNV